MSAKYINIKLFKINRFKKKISEINYVVDLILTKNTFKCIQVPVMLMI